MNNLAMGLVRLCRRNRDGSFATQANRQRGLIALANELYEMGFKLPAPHSIKPKHVQCLITRWQEVGLAAGTIKNRVGWIRWWAHKVNKASILPRMNRELGLAERPAARRNRAQTATEMKRLPEPRMQCALALMQAFGLRFEEALKLRPAEADQGTTLKLQASWTKGGRGREVPIHTAQQRRLLATVRQLVGNGSLIPSDRTYIQFRKAMEHELAKAGIRNVHGLRHGYAQARYQALTGWPCPQAGGPRNSDMTMAEQRLDAQVRYQIAEELGHSRLSITKVYLG